MKKKVVKTKKLSKSSNNTIKIPKGDSLISENLLMSSMKEDIKEFNPDDDTSNDKEKESKGNTNDISHSSNEIKLESRANKNGSIKKVKKVVKKKVKKKKKEGEEEENNEKDKKEEESPLLFGTAQSMEVKVAPLELDNDNDNELD